MKLVIYNQSIFITAYATILIAYISQRTNKKEE